MFDPHFFKHKHFGPNFRRGGPFGGHSDEGGGGRKRQRRGDIKFILLALLQEQPRHGYELIKALEEQSSGFYRPSPGMIYPTLQLLEDEGSLTSKMVDDKRVYTITEAGQRALLEHASDRHEGHRGPWQNGFGGERAQFAELRRSSVALFEVVMQAARYGTPEQVQAVQSLLNKANQDVHAILAKGDDVKNV